MGAGASNMNLNPLPLDTSPYYTSHHTGNVNSLSTALSADRRLADTLDLSVPARDLLGTLRELEPEARSEYLENLATLLQAGVVGVETLGVRGRPYDSFAGTRFADPRLSGARLAR